MSYAACFMDTWLGEMYLDDLGRPYYLYKGKKVKRVSMVHDEYSFECEDGVEDEVTALTVKAIVKAGEYMKPYRDWETDRKSTRLNSSHSAKSRMPSSA